MGDSTGTQNQQALYGCTNCHEDYSWHAVELRVDDAGKCWCQDCWEYSDYVTTLGRWYELEPFIPLQTKRIKELEAQLADKEGQRAWLQNELDAALRRIDGLNAQHEGWQPIETAPKDGTVVLLLSPEGEDEGHWEEVRYCVLGSPQGAFGAGWVDSTNNLPIYAEFEPTHWMPLPAAPDSATSAGGE